MMTKHLDVGCGPCPRNPYNCDEVFAVDLSLPPDVDLSKFVHANLSLEPIPFPDSTFDSVSAFDFLEHVPRVLATLDGRGTRFPFVELMNEIHRVLKPGGRFYAVTPAYPSPEAFQDPTHVNIITEGTWRYFCGVQPQARMYGFVGDFELSLNQRALFPEAFKPETPIGWWRKHRRNRLLKTHRLSHLQWEFICLKRQLGG
jgi:SAM-dependent methyltransferase